MAASDSCSKRATARAFRAPLASRGAAARISSDCPRPRRTFPALPGFALALNRAGIGVYADDHRGHGHTAAPGELGFFAAQDGWRSCLDDLWTLNRRIAADHPDAPIFFFGHSMGSLMGQSFIADHGAALAGAILSGSNGRPPAIAALGGLVARFERWRLGPRGKSALLKQMMFGEFNKPFRPARTEFDWLSRDPRKSTPMSPTRCAASISRLSSSSTCSAA